MVNFKKITILLIMSILVFTLSFTGVTYSEDDIVIAFSQSTMGHPWRVALTNDMKDAAEKFGVELIWTDGELDAAKQLQDVEDLLAQEPDALIITPLQKETLTPVYDMAKEADVPLIVIDREINAEPGTGTFISLITQDYVETGRRQAHLIADALKQKYGEPRGDIFYLDGTPGSSVVKDMYAGFTEVIEEQYPDIEIINRKSGKDARGPSMTVTEDILVRYSKGEIDAINAYNDQSAFGAIDAIKESAREELLGMVTGMAAQKGELKRILEGEMFGSVSCPPYYGDIAIKTAVAYLNGEEVPANQQIPLQVYRADTQEKREKTKKAYNYLVENDLVYPPADL